MSGGILSKSAQSWSKAHRAKKSSGVASPSVGMTSALIPNLKSLENQLRDDAVINTDRDHINTREPVHDVVFAMESVIDYNSKNNENMKDSPDSSDDVNTGSFVQSPRLVIAHDVDESSNNSGFSDSMEVSGSYFNYNGDSLSPDHPRNAPVTPIIENGVEKFPCHLCSFYGHSRSQLYDHLDGHFEHKCDQCDYTSRTEGRLKQHIQRFHLNQENINDDTKDGSLSPDSQRYVDGMSSDQLSPTTPNSRTPGRQKVYRCKQCDFTATVKTEFWNHARVHIKDEKLLQCPKCPFVTEYKHHLEYHLRNHFGSKPFKCSKCNYACVNKSMLNSHMKSHTNIYQYRCADCTYATKYCHSLKLHLRKYNHKPSSILNLDGTLDHDTSSLLTMKRSGPKSNKLKEDKDSSPENSFIPQSPNNGVRFQVPPPNMMPFWPLGGSLAAGMRPNPPPLLPLHLSSFFRGFLPPVMQQMQVNPERVENDSKVLDAIKSLNSGQVKLEPGQQSMGNTEILNMFNGSLGKPGTSAATSNSTWPRPDLFGLLAPLSSTQIKEDKHEEMRTDIIKQNHQQSNSGLTGESPLDLRKSSTGEDASPMQDASGRKRSRKGKAYKLDAFCLKLQEKMEADDDDSDNKGSVNGERSSVASEREVKRSSPESEAASITSLDKVTDQKTSSPSSKLMNQEQNNNNPEMLDGVIREDMNRTSGTEVTQDLVQKLQFPFMIGKSADTEVAASYKERYTCNYCDISFSNCVMYTMHMGYHDFKNPFKCNLCGAETTDKVAFFLHIARAAHL